MIQVLFIALLAQTTLAAPAAPTPDAPMPAASEATKPDAIVAWQGTLSAGREELQRLSNAGEHDAAIALGTRVLAMPSWSEQSEERRAEALFDLGVALGAAQAIEPAADAFHKTRGLAGSRPIGLDAIYNAGTFRLLAAEELRLQVPEVREKLGLQPLPQPAQLTLPAPNAAPNAASAPAEAPDALALARQAYLDARTDLVDRLRCDARDRDTRANLELVQRRLRELDEIEKKREEEQQKQEQQDQQKQDEKQDGEQDPKQDPKQDQQKDQQQDPKDSQDEEQQKPDEEQQQKPDEQKPEDGKQAQPDPKDVKEEQLSREEVMRLLDQLQKIEEQAEQVRAQMRERRRVPVKKDW